MKIYIDTNWFLSFYQSSHERQDVLESVADHAELVVMTEQNCTEFRRNRSALLQTLRKHVEKTSNIVPHTTSLLLGLQEHAQVLQAARNLGDATQALLAKLDDLEQSTLDDRVSITFNELLSKCTVVPVTDEDVLRAQKRKARGIPPSSSKRDTIGDEVIWECLLRACEEDLVIVSLDRDFLQQKSLLASEFAAHPTRRRLIHVGDRLGEVMKQFAGLTAEEYERAHYVSPDSRCPSCGSGT